MGIKERISKIEEYFKEMQIISVDNTKMIYITVTFPKEWVIDDELENLFKVQVVNGEYLGDYYFFTEIENGEDVIFDSIEYNIEKMKEAVERAHLLNEKTKELRKIFENEDISLQQLRNLNFSYEENLDSSVLNKKKEKNENNLKKENSENE